MYKLLIILIISNILPVSFAKSNGGGGAVVGNGAGIAENFFQYAYQSLPKFISNCRAVNNCVNSDSDKELLEKISRISITNSSKLNRLIFLSGKSSPGFFDTGINERSRIAKTYLDADSSIYINTDMLYDINNKLTLNFSDMIRILVHEIGHQTGLEDHAQLDILGAKISIFSDAQTSSYRFKTDINEEKIEISINVINLDHPEKISLVSFNWMNGDSVNLTNQISSGVSCKLDSEKVEGIELTNGHFDIDEQGGLLFKSWLNLSCQDISALKTSTTKRNLYIFFGADFRIIDLKIK